MSETVISVNELGKRYRIGAKLEEDRNIREGILNAFKAPFRNFKRLRELTDFKRDNGETADDIIWALKDVSFEVNKGEVIGIIGKNGSGKSTLLKILSRITEPTTGRVEIKGRISSLLEVGTGFHKELTGRENIYLNGAILGMRKWEIDKKFDEIVAFSEIEKFIDTPVKRYSSGMYVRLAFAVAAHLEPEILLVDEVLAVGDVAFQKKCLGKMNEVAKEGRTVLFVSHNMRAITTLCHKAILLDNGKLSKAGDVDYIIQSYLMDGNRASSYKPKNNNEDFILSEVNLESETGEKRSLFFYSEKIVIRITFISRISREWPRAGISIRGSLGGIVFSSGYKDFREKEIFNTVGPVTFSITIPSCWLNVGCYSLDVSAHYPNVRTVFNYSSCVSLIIEEDNQVPGSYGVHRAGVLRPKLCWEIIHGKNGKPYFCKDNSNGRGI